MLTAGREVVDLDNFATDLLYMLVAAREMKVKRLVGVASISACTG